MHKNKNEYLLKVMKNKKGIDKYISILYNKHIDETRFTT